MIISFVTSIIAFIAVGIYVKRYLEHNGYAERGMAKMLAFVIATLSSILVGSGVDKAEDFFKSPGEIQQDKQEEQQLKDALKQLQAPSSEQPQDMSP